MRPSTPIPTVRTLELLDRRLTGEASSNEQAELAALLGSPTAQPSVVAVVANLLNDDGNVDDSFSDQRLHALHARLGLPAPIGGEGPETTIPGMPKSVRTSSNYGQLIIPTLRSWFNTATLRVVAMFLDVREPSMPDDEIRELRERIDRAQRGTP